MASTTAALDGPAGPGGSPAAPPPAAPPRPTAFPPLKGSQLVLGTIALSLATFMNVLDTSIANVSIPAISGDLGVSPNQGTWVITSFAVANAISVPLTGWLTQRFGQVRLFTASVLLFVIASWLCGLAPSMGLLIFFRVLQGFVAGPMIPLSQTLLLASYPQAKAGSAMAMWAMTVLVAPVAGPLLGGWITDNISWPWIFYINVPLGLGAMAVTWQLFRDRQTPPRRIPLDRIGLSRRGSGRNRQRLLWFSGGSSVSGDHFGVRAGADPRDSSGRESSRSIVVFHLQRHGFGGDGEFACCRIVGAG